MGEKVAHKVSSGAQSPKETALMPVDNCAWEFPPARFPKTLAVDFTTDHSHLILESLQSEVSVICARPDLFG